jgi:hypothetical protein
LAREFQVSLQPALRRVLPVPLVVPLLVQALRVALPSYFAPSIRPRRYP